LDNEDDLEASGETGSIDQGILKSREENDRYLLRRGVYPITVSFLSW
jgi:hypothetical protein